MQLGKFPVVVILLALSVITKSTNPLPEKWKEQILFIIENFKQLMVTNPPSPVAPTIMDNDPIEFLCPDILLWSPLDIFPNLCCPVCADALVRTELSPLRWQVGNSERTQPRKILSSKSIVLLVSHVYKCSQGHEVIAHDPGILSSIPSASFHLIYGTRLVF